MQTHEHTASYAATRQAHDRDPAMVLVRKLIDQHPDADEETLMDFFRAEVAEDETLFEDVVDYKFKNVYRRLITSRPSDRSNQQSRVSAGVKAAKAAMADYLANLQVLPDGTKLLDATGAQVASHAGWWTDLAGQLEPDEIVRTKFSVADLASLYRKHHGL